MRGGEGTGGAVGGVGVGGGGCFCGEAERLANGCKGECVGGVGSMGAGLGED